MLACLSSVLLDDAIIQGPAWKVNRLWKCFTICLQAKEYGYFYSQIVQKIA